MTRTVLVTGASGFIGAPLVRALARRGFEVRGAARDPASVPAMDARMPSTVIARIGSRRSTSESSRVVLSMTVPSSRVAVIATCNAFT